MCLFSLAAGFRATWVQRNVRTGISMIAAPFWKILASGERAAGYVSGFFISYHTTCRQLRQCREQLVATMPDAVAFREIQAENRRLRKLIHFQSENPALVLRPVKVEVIYEYEGILTIDQGSLQGIHEGMCAITPQGIVGVVAHVGTLESRIYTLYSPYCRIGALLQRNRAFGIVRGTGSDNRNHICRMEYIDQKDSVLVGDIVISSGGRIFPRGFPIGRITEIPEKSGVYQVAYVEPFANPRHLDEVFLVERRQVSWKERAADNPIGKSSVGVPLPDDTTLQERYAP